MRNARGLQGILAGALALGVVACSKEAPPPPAVKPPTAVIAPAEPPKPEPPKPPPMKANFGPGDLALGTPIELLGGSQFFMRLKMAVEPGGANFGGLAVLAYLEDTRVDPAKGIHFCVQNADASAFGGRKAKGEYQLFTPNLLQRDPLAVPASGTACVQGGDTLWNEFRKVENAGLPRGTGEAWGQPVRVEIQVRARKVDLVELVFPTTSPEAFNAIMAGFAQDVGPLVEPPLAAPAAAGQEGCDVVSPASGAPAFLQKKAMEVRVVFGAAAPSGCAQKSPAVSAPAK